MRKLTADDEVIEAVERREIERDPSRAEIHYDAAQNHQPREEQA